MRKFRYHESVKNLIVQLNKRGQLTLPAEVRRALGLEPGDTLLLRVEKGKVVLEPAVVLPVEIYDEDRLLEFERAARLSPEEVRRIRERWNL